MNVSLKLRPAVVSWQSITTTLHSTLSQLSSAMLRTINLLLILSSSEGETASQSHKDGPNLPEQLRKVIGNPRFDMLEDVKTTLQQGPGAPSLASQGFAGAVEVERHMRGILAPWETRGILSVRYVERD